MVYFNWSVGICLIQMSVSILAGAAAFTDYWGVDTSESIHFGLILVCAERNNCATITGTGDAVNLFIAVMVIGMVASFPCCILEFSKGLKYNLFHCFVSALMAILAFAAMTHTIVLFNRLTISFYYSWSFGLGWLTVIIALASAILSYFTRQKDSTDDSEAPGALQAASNELVIASHMSNTGQSFPVIVTGHSTVKV